MKWRLYSPDLNAIGHVWVDLGRGCYISMFSTAISAREYPTNESDAH